MNMRPPVFGPRVIIANATLKPVRLTIVALGGGARDVASSGQQVVDVLATLSTHALIVFTSDKEWAKEPLTVPSHLANHADGEDTLELILGERVGEDLDVDLRASTKYRVNKPSDITSIVANM